MQKNNAGGYAWRVDDWKLMSRMLILGTESGTYYVGEKELTKAACAATLRCIQEDGIKAVDLIVDISDKGRAAKNDYALFALAMAAGEGNLVTRRAAFAALPKVARIGTHLFNFATYMQQFRGWGRLAREGIAKWYNDMPLDRLAYQVVKYRQRDGWTHRDLLRLAHPQPEDSGRNALYKYITSGPESVEAESVPNIAFVFENAKLSKNVGEVVKWITDADLTREMIPTEWLKEPDVWAALLENMPMTAMIRNLGNMGKVGLLVPGNFDAIQKVCSDFADKERLKKSRIHPLNVLSALTTYASGHSYRGSGTWQVVGDVVDTLDNAFYLAFDNVEPSNQRICIGLDVSGSMNWGEINGIPNMTPRVGAAAMCMVTYKTEPLVTVGAFCKQFVPVDMSRHRRLDDLVRYTNGLPFGGTDCAVPMLTALEAHKNNSNVVYDAFIVITDNETWAGHIHPIQALNLYRQQVNPNAKLVVVGMTANQITIADPQDSGVLDVVGFDTAAPATINQFLRGEI
jgi:60 kDa SS-A/Ro ribonucleoprotein